MQASSFRSCVAVIVAALAPQTLRNNASVSHAVTATQHCRCILVITALAKQVFLHCCCHCPAVFVSTCGTTAPTKMTAVTEVAVMPISAARREGTTQIHSTKEQKQKQNSATTAACVACTMMMMPRCSLHHGAGNARVFALRCCCCCPANFFSICGRRAQQPTIAQGGGGTYVMVDTCFFGLTKNKDKKKLESLLPILNPLSFFIVSLNTTL
jgi:hypothetical protein